MKDSCIIYLHGTLGNYLEYNDYLFLDDIFDVMGLDYQDGNAWDIAKHVMNEFERITKGYKNIYVIGASFGAWLCIKYLFKYNIKGAIFYSPLVSMKDLIDCHMKRSGVTLEELKEKEFITLSHGKTLWYDYYMEASKPDEWRVPTQVIFGQYDHIISRTSINEFVKTHDAKLAICEGAPHWFVEPNHIEFRKNIINNFFRK